MGGDLREIVDAEQIGRVFAALALVMPPLCILCGWMYGRLRGIRRGVLYGFLLGLLGPLNWLLWRVYNGITEAVGLDTVRNLVINLVVFLVVGVVVGIGAGFVVRRGNAHSTGPQPTDKAE